MKILWHSTTPEVHSGYGVITAAIVPRLIVDGHVVRIATKHPYHDAATLTLEDPRGVPRAVGIVEGTLVNHMTEMMRRDSFDVVYTGWDIWTLKPDEQFPADRWLAHVPVDTEVISNVLARAARGARWVAAMSLHGQGELGRVLKRDVPVMPLGVDTSVYKPDAAARREFRESFGMTEDDFVVGSVGLNYADDRKGFVPLLAAFKRFLENVPKAYLYLHTHAGTGVFSNTVKLQEYIRYLGIGNRVIFPDEIQYDLGIHEASYLAMVYNVMDVFCLPTKGEGFGLPLIEAQACGTPVIVTATTSGTELGAFGFTIPPTFDDIEYLPTMNERVSLRPSRILSALDVAHEEWRSDDKWTIRKRAALGMASGYAWDEVYGKYWRPMFETVERELRDGEKQKPE